MKDIEERVALSPSNALEQIISDPEQLEMTKAISTVSGFRKMLEFARERFQEESLLFFRAAREFKLAAEPTEKLFLAKQIYSDFITNGSSYQINITGEVREGIDKKMLHKEWETMANESEERVPQDDTYDWAILEILKLIQENLWLPFSIKHADELRRWKEELPLLGTKLLTTESNQGFLDDVQESGSKRPASNLVDELTEVSYAVFGKTSTVEEKEKEEEEVKEKKKSLFWKSITPMIIMSALMLLILILVITVAKWQLGWKGYF